MVNRSLRRDLRGRPGGGSPRQGVIVEGLRGGWTDVYHNAMTVGWPMFIAALAAMFFVINLVFAALYALQSACVANAVEFAQLFFFSVETFSTTGYGDMHPQTFYGHAVASSETFASLIATAAVTGLIFARFSRPRARLMFARSIIVSRHEGVDSLIVRVANARHSFLSQATAKFWWLGPIQTAEGRRYVGFLPMTLLRSETPALSLSWTLFHPIDENSPLYGKSPAQLLDDKVNIVVSIAGLDEISSQAVHSRHVYAVDEIKWGHEFADMFHVDKYDQRHVDFSKIHDTQPVEY